MIKSSSYYQYAVLLHNRTQFFGSLKILISEILVAYRGQYNTNEPDKMIEWARGKGWGFRGHCLFWDVEDDSHYPDWVKPLAGQDMVDAIYGRLESAVNHYRVRACMG